MNMIAQPCDDDEPEGSHEHVMTRIESRLMTGYPRVRLAVECGILSIHLDRLLKRDFYRSYNARYGTYSETDHLYFDKVDDYIEALKKWLADEAKSQAATAQFASTPTSQAIHGIIERARIGKQIVAIIGGVGVGKSEAAKAYIATHPRTHRKPGFARVEFNKGSSNPTAALHAIMSALVGEHGGRRPDALIYDIGRELRPGDGLILDECNYLGEAIDAVRDLWDAYHVPIVVMGNPDFGKMVFTGNKKTAFSAFASRVLRHDIPVTKEEDVDAWLDWAGLSGSELRRVAIAIACRPGEHGGLRSLALLVEQCRALMQDGPIVAENLLHVAEYYGRGVGRVLQ